MAKILVTYFSASGVTAKVAEKLAKAAKADLFEIKPEVPYSSADLDWTNKKSRSSVEMADKTSRVAMSGKVENMAQYDTVFVGFPIWWGVAPHIVNSFLEAYDFSGKTIHLFATSGGSGMGRSMEELKASAPGAAWGAEKKLSAGISQADADAWVKEILK